MNDEQRAILRDEAGKAERNPQIEKEFAYMEEIITALGETTRELEVRLEIVMKASRGANESKEAEKRPDISPLGGKLEAYNLRLQNIRSSIIDILDRLDL